MGKGINKVTIIGNLGADPVVRMSSTGGSVTSINVATSESWKDKESGKLQEKTEWHKITLFGKLAEISGEYLKKGSKVYIEARLQTRSYEKDGQKRYVTDIIAHEMQMLSSKDSDGDAYLDSGTDTDSIPF